MLDFIGIFQYSLKYISVNMLIIIIIIKVNKTKFLTLWISAQQRTGLEGGGQGPGAGQDEGAPELVLAHTCPPPWALRNF